MQLTHDAHTPGTQTKELVLLCDGIKSPANQGAIFRLADAFAVKELIFCDAVPDMSSSRLKKIARSTQDHIPYACVQEGSTTLQELKAKGYKTIALEITASSMPLFTIDFNHRKLLLIIGNEQNGVSQELLNQVDTAAHIPMYGHNSSMNVAQAAAIALYQLSL